MTCIWHWLTQFAEVLERPDWLERYRELVRRLSGWQSPTSRSRDSSWHLSFPVICSNQ